VPMEELGGDFYDVFPLDDHRVGMMIGDVCGHGIPSALIATIAKSAFMREFKRSKKLSSLVKRVNEQLSDTYPSNGENYLTAFVAVFDRNTRELAYCNAGHPHPLIYRRGSKRFDVLKAAVGNPFVLFSRSSLSRSFSWKDSAVTLKKGDYLFAFTDGLTDCFNSENVKFNKRISLLGGMDFDSSDSLLKYVIGERKTYADRSGDDDIACLVMGVK
jgi:phosphoserine phosphatase RsbU/P